MRRPNRSVVARMALLGCGALGTAAVASAGAIELPSAPQPHTAAAPAPIGAAADGTTRTGAAPNRLGVGARGALVRDLQRQLRRRGLRLGVDGVFGAATRRALMQLQRRLGLAVTGDADRALLRRLGLNSRRIASGTPGSTAAGSGYVKAFPVGGEHSYSDDWGAARSQGGHEGTDIMADRHTPAIAADNGVISKISRTETGLGGIYLWLRRGDGTQYYYAHMQSIVPGLNLGSRVSAGQQVGTIGNSGDARYGVTHLHFEIRRGWTPFNPYPELARADADHR